MKTGSLWVARHAPVAVTNTCYGRTDVCARIPHDVATAELVKAYPGARPAVVWSSPSSRCRALAERVAGHYAAALRVDESLHELDFGAWDGCTWPAIESRDREAYARWMQDWQEVAPPGGERPRELEARARSWVESLDLQHDHALIAHAGVVRALRVVIENRTWRQAMESAVEHLAWLRFALPPPAPEAKLVKQGGW